MLRNTVWPVWRPPTGAAPQDPRRSPWSWWCWPGWRFRAGSGGWPCLLPCTVCKHSQPLHATNISRRATNVSPDAHSQATSLQSAISNNEDNFYSLTHQLPFVLVVVVFYFEDVPVVEFMYHVFTRRPGESYRRSLRSLLLHFALWILSTNWFPCCLLLLFFGFFFGGGLVCLINQIQSHQVWSQIALAKNKKNGRKGWGWGGENMLLNMTHITNVHLFSPFNLNLFTSKTVAVPDWSRLT